MDRNAERELIAQCRHGEPAAWDQLFDAHYEVTARFIYQLSPEFTREDVEEICQETFLAVIRSLNGFNGASRLQTWILRVATNKSHDHRERQHAAKRGGGLPTQSLHAQDPETGLTLDPPSSLPSPDSALIKEENAALLHQALHQLANPCREIIELRYFGDLSYDEIANLLALNVKTVSSRLSKCLDRLETLAHNLFNQDPQEKSRPFSV
jgi:RNA polymerase sigma-70 factor, ECF subfamily